MDQSTVKQNNISVKEETGSEYESESMESNDEEFNSSDFDSSLSEDEYFEDDLIPEEPETNNQEVEVHNPVIQTSNFDRNFTDGDFEWRTGYTTRWRQSTRSASNNNHKFPINDLLNERSKSELNLTFTQAPKKRLSVDLSSPVDSTPQPTSLFKSIGNWFRGSTRFNPPKTNKTVKETESGVKIAQPVARSKSVVGTAFSSFPIEANNKFNSNKKVIKFDEESLTTSDDNSSDEASETSSTESSSKQNKFINKNFDSVESYSEDGTELDIGFELISSNQPQCLSWQRQFRKISGVNVENKKLDCDIVADALIIPGNSFGLLDGWPEIEYIKLFGWNLQRHLRKQICENYDGELLIGQAILLPLPLITTPSDNIDVINESDDKTAYETNCCHDVKNIIYVPVMRVPINLKDSVNAYLAFKAAICAVKKHNEKSLDDGRIRTVVCPALCGDLGMMPPSRIALQMRTAYEAYVLNKRHKISNPTDLGYLATNHVELTTAKTGGWC